MSRLPQINPSSPGIRRRAQRYARLLCKALEIAARKDAGRGRQIAAIYRTAHIEGVDPDLRLKKATVSLRGRPLQRSLHLIYDWHILDALTPSQIAELIASSLSKYVRR